MKTSGHIALSTLLLSVGVALACLTGCRSNTAITRQTKALTTKYNIYFNGYEAWKAGMQAMEKSHNEDYSRPLQLHPVYAYVGKEPKQESNFERAIEKCKMAVQRRSITEKPKKKQNNSPEYKEWMQRGEYNPYLHNAWLLSGRAQFYEGDFNAAIATYNYIEHHFKWKPLAIAECQIMTARAYAIQGYTYDAESQLELLIPHKQYSNLDELKKNETYRNLTRRLQREFCLCEAEILLSRPQTRMQAIPYLNVARKGFVTREQKIRTDFLIAQLHEQEGQNAEAYRRYGNVVHHARDYKTQFNARIARTRVMPGMTLRKVERRLNHLRFQSRNADYLDQIYYALGNVALKQQDTTKAIIQYEKAVEKSTRGGNEKAVAALALGQLTFEQADYVKAQKAYSIVMGIIKEEDWKQEYKEIQHISQVLDELQTHAETVQLQDSLLWLSTLDEKELDKVIDNLIKELKKKEKEAAEAEALAAYNDRKSTQVDPLAQNEQPQPTVGQQDKSWYFYNPSLIAAGKSEFQRKWGARKPEDDWRRKNKTETFADMEQPADTLDTATDEALAESSEALADSLSSAVADNSQQVAKTDSVSDEDLNDPHKPAYYLAQIPRTDEQKATCHQLIEEGLYNMAVIINEKLENFPLSIQTFDKMERRYPESQHLPDSYYASYLMSMRMASTESLIAKFGHDQQFYLDQAEFYRKKLLAAFPESAYGTALSDPNYMETLREMEQGQDSLYIKTYEAYLRASTDSVHMNYYFVHEKWPLSKLMPKFLFLHALSYIQENDIDSFREALEQLTATYPESDVSPLAGLIVKGIHEGRNVQLGQGVNRGILWAASLRKEGEEGGTVDSTMVFREGDDEPYVLLLAYQKDSLYYGESLPKEIQPENNLLFEIAKFDFENYLVKDFDLEIIESGGGLSVLVISGFDNLDELEEYHGRMESSTSIDLPDGITMIDISAANFRVLLAGRTFEEYFEWIQKTYGER